MWRHAGAAAIAGLFVMSAAPGNDVVLVDAQQSVCGTTAFCPADPAPDAGDQATAEQRIMDGYVKKQVNCTPDLPPNPQSITWDPPGSRRTSGAPVSSAMPIRNWAASTAPTM